MLIFYNKKKLYKAQTKEKKNVYKKHNKHEDEKKWMTKLWISQPSKTKKKKQRNFPF